jgi:transmembrane sensor
MKTDNDANIKTAARDWLLRMSLESPPADEQARFEAWCLQDPRHLAAYRRFESIWQDAATLKELEPLAALPVPRDPWWSRMRASFAVHPLRWAGSAGFAVAAAGIGVWLLLAPVYYATGLAEVRAIRLSDGSEVTLGARSSLEVAFRFRTRSVLLTSGVAFFSVAKNPSRPFVVRVGDKEVRVLGTQFEIRSDPDAMRVSVVEGAVEVMQVPDRASPAAQQPPRGVRLAAKATEPDSATIPNGTSITPTLLTKRTSPEERILTAGQQVTAALAGAVPDAQVMPRGEPAAWRYGRLVYVDAPLKDIVADANRYSHAPIKLADERVANIRVSVTYPSDRVEEMVTALSRSLSLEIDHPASGGIVLKPRGHKE